MTPTRWLCAALLLAVPLTVFVGCAQVTTGKVASVDQSAIKWYYYPEQDIYYSPSHLIYWYRVQPANQWVSSAQLPPTVTLRGRNVTVADKSREPWRRHHEHVEAYRDAGK